MDPNDPQDPLPESNWFWRRLFIFLLTLSSMCLVAMGAWSLYTLRDPGGVYRVTKYLIGLVVLLSTYYMVAPSAEQITKMLQTAKLLHHGMRAPQEAPPVEQAAATPSQPTVAGGAINLPEEANWR